MMASIASVVLVCLVLSIGLWFLWNRAGSQETTTAPMTVAPLPVESLTLVNKDIDRQPMHVDMLTSRQASTVDTEFKMLEFAFEPKLLPGRVPDASTKMVVKPSGFAPFKFVGCESTGYSIRWMGRYLTLDSSSSLRWSTDKQEPNSCFQISPGYCDSTEYIMLRSLFNRHFVRVDGNTNKLVCVDGPTRNTSDQFCWKLTNDEPQKMPCGPQFLPDYGRVVNIPCSIKATPPCGDATPGFKSACCLRHPDDPTCAGSVFREVMGRPIAEAALYIKTRHPGLTIKKCERTDRVCNALKPFPVYDENTVVLPYDKKFGVVSGPAFRFI